MATVNLVSYSKPAEDFVSKDEVQDIQELVAYCARVSNPGNQTNSETAPKLLKYLMAMQCSTFRQMHLIMIGQVFTKLRKIVMNLIIGEYLLLM